MSVKAVERTLSLKAADVMTKEVVAIDGGATVAQAIALMRERRVSSLLVNRLTHDDTWGMLVSKDVVIEVIHASKDPRKVKVFDIMTKPVIMISPGLALKYCISLMHQAGIRRAPVFDGKDIVGIISNTDIFNALEV